MNSHVRTFLFTLVIVCFQLPLLAQDTLRLEERVPVVTGISPVSGPVGTIVTIQGKNFSPVLAENFVRMGGIVCPVLSATSTELTIRIPVGMNSQRLVVMSKGGLITMTDYLFRVTFESLGKTLGKRSVRLVWSYWTRGTPKSVITADLNNDGVLEIFSLENAEGVLFHRNKNQRKFAYKLKKFENTRGEFSNSGDLDGDGVEEILVNTSGFEILQNKSYADSFDYKSVFRLKDNFTGNTNLIPKLVDLNEDGRPDLVCRTDSGLLLIENSTINRELSFREIKYKRVSERPNQNSILLLGDLDGDGKQEIVLNAGSNYNMLYILRNIHDQGQSLDPDKLELAHHLSLSKLPNFVMNLEDIDGDGKLDLYFLGVQDSTLSIYRNISEKGRFVFENPIRLSTQGNNVESIFTDIDGDGLRDLVSSRQTNSDDIATNFGSYYLKNTSTPGKIQFDPTVGINIKGHMLSVMDGDLDENGTPDLIFSNASEWQVEFLKNATNDAGVKLAPDSPPVGYIDQSMFLDDSIRTHNNAPFVRRHYEITPFQNDSTAKATITLYFTQQDFTEFNAYRPDDNNLPTGPDDATGKANLRVYK